jgi:hypothetical protein
VRIEAVHDATGVIVAAIAFANDDDSQRPRPVADDGQFVGVFDVPDEYAKTPLDVLCTTLRVDVHRGTLVDRELSEGS